MSGILSPRAQAQLAALASLSEKVHRVHGLVEQYAASRGVGADHIVTAMTRTFSQLKLHFMGAGMDAMSQLCGAMEIASRRGMSTAAKLRILREGVGSLRFQLELAQRAVVSDDRATQPKDAPDGSTHDGAAASSADGTTPGGSTAGG
jgi:hypothetical protein